ncbi:PAS domain S-box protein [Phenylobacterium sp.]|jgi:PAS domain S-box-containing protein|uniref:PAS domain S-box protein n=1 Tax=Phenylobacterium sp. TaxID=1871053 RepID=UPI0037831F72
MPRTAGSNPVTSVDEVLITAELASRPSRTPDYEAESRGLGVLAQEMATNPRGVLQKCAELVMELCHADSAGISVLEPGGTGGMLRWRAAAGGFAQHLNGVMPQEASPCGTVMARNSVLLFHEAERFFPALRGVEPPIYENLLAPWHAEGNAVGTVWAIKHSPEGRFEAEDARVLQSIAGFTAAAFKMISALDEATEERSAAQASEEQLRDALDSLTEGFALFDADFTILDVNAETLRLDGRTRDELVGRNHWEAFPGSEDSPLGRMFKRVAHERRPEAIEHSYTWPGDKTMWLDTHAYPTSHGRVGVLWRDITERKQTEQALRESEEKFRTLFESMHEAFAICELVRGANGQGIDYRYVELNPAVERHTGLSPESLIGRRASEVFGTVDPWLLETYNRVVDEGASVLTEHHFANVDRWLRINLFPRGGDRLAVLYSDVTERYRAEAALRESEERQAFMLKLSDAFRPFSDPADIQGEVTRLLREQLSAGWCYYVDWDVDRKVGRVLRDSAREGLPSLAGSHDVSDAPEFLQLLADGAVRTVRDYANYENLPTRIRQNFVGLGFRSMMMAPLVKGGRLTATLLVGDTGPRDWSTNDASLLVEVAERTWASIERGRAEEALRQSEERLGLAIEIGGLASWDWDVRSGHVTWSDRHYLMQGYAVGEVTLSFEAWLARVHPEDREETVRRIEAARDERGVYIHEFRTLWPDGTVRWCSARGRFFYGAGGAPERMIGVMEDVTARRHADEALRSSEERFRQFAEASAAGLWIRTADTLSMEYVSPAVSRIYGVEPDRLLGDVKAWAAMIVPEDRDTALAHLDQARAGGTMVHEFRIQRPDGTFRWIRNTDFPLEDAKGHVARIGGIAEDVTEAKLLTEHQGVLLAELQHRVRNIMAMIRSMALRTADGATDVEDYRALLEGRLMALARVQVLLTREANAGGSLRDIITSEVSAQAHREDQFELDGPAIRLSPKAVEVLTLAFHELATNGLKYGAFSLPQGRLRVSWRPFEKRGRTWLALDWKETGGPPREPSKRRGFGSDLIEGRIPYELGGTGNLTLEPEGAHCRMEFPLKEGESILETDAPTETTVFGGILDMTDAPDLTGHRILVVEDDYYLAGDTAAALRGAGADVLGPCPSEDATLDLLESQTPTHAVLDLNLGGGDPKFAIARVLKARGVPFVFMTGYDPDAIPTEFELVPRLQKPVPFRKIVETVSQL